MLDVARFAGFLLPPLAVLPTFKHEGHPSDQSCSSPSPSPNADASDSTVK